MRKRFYADLHLGAPNELNISIINDEDTILLGDIWCLARCKYSEVASQEQQVDTFMARFLGRYLLGNHEKRILNYKVLHRILVIGKTIMTHGHWEANPTRWLKHMKGKKGSGFIGRAFAKALDYVEEFREDVNSPEFLERAADLAIRNNCDTYICGHFHVKKMVVKVHKGVTIKILPRGMTELEIE